MLYTHTVVLFGIIGVSLASEGGWIPKCHHEKIADSDWDLEVQLKSDDSAIRFQMKNPRSMQFVSEVFERNQLTMAGISTQMPIEHVSLELDQICKDSQVWIEQSSEQESFILLFSKFEANDIPDTQLEFPVRAHKMDEEQLRVLYSESLRQIELKDEHVQSLSDNVRSMRETINIAHKKFDEKNQELRELRIQLDELKDELKECQRKEIIADQIHHAEQSEWLSRSDIVNVEQIERCALENELIYLVLKQKQTTEEDLNRQVVSLHESNERSHLEMEEEHQRGELMDMHIHNITPQMRRYKPLPPLAAVKRAFDRQLVERNIRFDLNVQDYRILTGKGLGGHYASAGMSDWFHRGTHSVKIKIIRLTQAELCFGICCAEGFCGSSWVGSCVPDTVGMDGRGYVFARSSIHDRPPHPYVPRDKPVKGDILEVKVHIDEDDPSLSTIGFSQNGQLLGTELNLSEMCSLHGQQFIFAVSLKYNGDAVQIVD